MATARFPMDPPAQRTDFWGHFSTSPSRLSVANEHLPALLSAGFTPGSPDQPLQQGGNLWLFATERLRGENIVILISTFFWDLLPGRVAVAGRSSSPSQSACWRAAWGNDLGLKFHQERSSLNKAVPRVTVYRHPRQPPWAFSSPPGRSTVPEINN